MDLFFELFITTAEQAFLGIGKIGEWLSTPIVINLPTYERPLRFVPMEILGPMLYTLLLAGIFAGVISFVKSLLKP